jgi:hypothetical protein
LFAVFSFFFLFFSFFFFFHKKPRLVSRSTARKMASRETNISDLLDNFPDDTGQSLRSAGFTESDAGVALTVFEDDAGAASAWMRKNNHLDFRAHVQATTHLWKVLTDEMPPPALPAGTVHVPAAAGHLVDGSAILHRLCAYEEGIRCETNCCKKTAGPGSCVASQTASTCTDDCCYSKGISVFAHLPGTPVENNARVHFLLLKCAIKSRLSTGMKQKVLDLPSKFRPTNGAIAARIDAINTRADLVAEINDNLLPAALPHVCSTALGSSLNDPAGKGLRVVRDATMTDFLPGGFAGPSASYEHYHVQPSPGAMGAPELQAVATGVFPPSTWTLCPYILHAAGEITNLRLDLPEPDDDALRLAQRSLLEAVAEFPLGSDVDGRLAMAAASLAVAISDNCEAECADVMTPGFARVLLDLVRLGLVNAADKWYEGLTECMGAVLGMTVLDISAELPGPSMLLFGLSTAALGAAAPARCHGASGAEKPYLEETGADLVRDLSTSRHDAEELVRAAAVSSSSSSKSKSKSKSSVLTADAYLRKFEACAREPRAELVTLTNTNIVSVPGSIAVYITGLTRRGAEQAGQLHADIEDPRTAAALLARSARLHINADPGREQRWDPPSKVVFASQVTPLGHVARGIPVSQPDLADGVFFRTVRLGGDRVATRGKALARAASAVIDELRRTTWRESAPHRVWFLTPNGAEGTSFAPSQIYDNFSFKNRDKPDDEWCDRVIRTLVPDTDGGALKITTIANTHGSARQSGIYRHVVSAHGCVMLVLAWSDRVARRGAEVVVQVAASLNIEAE